MSEFVYHTLEPIYDKNSRILILGSMPSPKSRELGFYYANPQNRFWKIIPELLRRPAPQTAEERTGFLLENRIALWDVLKSCEIKGADDGSIRNPEPNDLSSILSAADIRAVFTTGSKAYSLYRRLCLPQTKRDAVSLPSTSPANCRRYTYQSLLDAYRAILPYLQE